MSDEMHEERAAFKQSEARAAGRLAGDCREDEAYEAGRLAGYEENADAAEWRGFVRGYKLGQASGRWMRWVYRGLLAAALVLLVFR